MLKTKPNSNGFTALYQQSPPRTAALLPRALLSANSTRFYVVVPPLTHRNADVPHTGSLGWQQLRATLDSLGRFGYDDVVLIDNGHQQGPLLRQSFARPVWWRAAGASIHSAHSQTHYAMPCMVGLQT